MTFNDCVVRFANLASTGISIEAAIQEAIDSIFDIGRWPGTTREVPLTIEMFTKNTTGEWILGLDAVEYDGVIGFRDANKGFGIRDVMALYKEKVNAGDRDFIDLGIEESEVGSTGEYDRYRCYRAPLWFSEQSLPMYALLKKEAPILSGNDLVPVESIPALKAAIQAVCYEYLMEHSLAANCWAMFERRMMQSDKQFHGNKHYSIGMDSSLRRRPTQFQ